jgi:general secretion pathway protein C
LNAKHTIRIVISTLKTLRLDGEAVATLAARAPRWVAAALIVLLGARAAYIVTDLFGAGAKPTGTASAPAPADLPQAAARLDLAGLISANLFGSTAPPPQEGPAPVTSMPLVLAGVMAGEDPQRGVAILGPSATTAKVYLVGSALPGGARLHAVYGDRVLLDRGGVIEALLLPRQQSSSGNAPPPPPPPLAAVNRVQRLVQENPGLVGDIIRPQAVLADGRQRGYRVYPGPNVQAFNKLGLRPGDMVTAINGTALDDPQRGGEIFGTLSSAADAHVTVMRNGRSQDLVLNLAQVAAEAERLSSEPAPMPTP